MDESQYSQFFFKISTDLIRVVLPFIYALTFLFVTGTILFLTPGFKFYIYIVIDAASHEAVIFKT